MQLFMLTYSTPPSGFRSAIDNCMSCLVGVDMDRLSGINPEMHEWLKSSNEDDTLDTECDEDAVMYNAIVHDASTGTTGCIKAISYKKVAICAKLQQANCDVSAMMAYARTDC